MMFDKCHNKKIISNCLVERADSFDQLMWYIGWKMADGRLLNCTLLYVCIYMNIIMYYMQVNLLKQLS